MAFAPMSNDKGFRSMSALVEALRKAEEGLRGGTLPLTALDEATNDARDLFERLIVLRHKAREAAQGKAQQGAAVQPAPPRETRPAPSPVGAAKPAVVQDARESAPSPAAPAPATNPAPSPIRLNTRPADPDPAATPKEEVAPVMKTAAEYLKEAQTSKPAPAMAAPARAAESVAEKLERARIADLAKAISLSDKFWFTKELFAGDAKAYEVGVSLLNSAKDVSEAQSFLKDELLTKLRTPPDAGALEAFSELIERRFA
jgi:hypothetical protein